MIVAAAILLAPVAAAPPAAPEPAEIVVRAARKKCRVQIADRVLSDPEFNARLDEWAKGVPVSVVVPAGTDYKCLAKIVFRLNDKGVRRVAFVDRPALP
jgi:biopolymer transport protein ExbD